MSKLFGLSFLMVVLVLAPIMVDAAADVNVEKGSSASMQVGDWSVRLEFDHRVKLAKLTSNAQCLSFDANGNMVLTNSVSWQESGKEPQTVRLDGLRKNVIVRIDQLGKIAVKDKGDALGVAGAELAGQGDPNQAALVNLVSRFRSGK